MLDVSLDLQNDLYHPHRISKKHPHANKKNIYMNSNHPPNTKRELPNMIQDILSAFIKKQNHV